MIDNKKQKLKIGAVNFINAYPLASNLKTHDIIYDIPSILADKLVKKELDIALISSIEYARNFNHYRIISDLCISSFKKVDSILLFSKVDSLDKIKILKYDISSRSSVAMLKIIFNKKVGSIPKFSSCNTDEIENYMLSSNDKSSNGNIKKDQEEIDAILLIGDNALKYKDISINNKLGSFVKIYDLGTEWYNLFNLPFVYALWVGWKGIEIEGLYFENTYKSDLNKIKDILLKNNNYTDFNYSYLTDTIHYKLTEKHLESLEIFFSEAVKISILDDVPTLP